MEAVNTKSTGTANATHDELCDGALEHYQRLSDECHHWYSLIPRMIEFYRKYGREEMPDSEIEAFSRIVHHAYCEEYQRQKGEAYWTKGDYDLLDEETKEYDRITTRAIFAFMGRSMHPGTE